MWKSLKFLLLILASSEALYSTYVGMMNAVKDLENPAIQRLIREFDEMQNAESATEVRSLFLKRMLRFMNTSVDPCDDFFDYACGNYVEYLEGSSIANEYVLADLFVTQAFGKLLEAENRDEYVPRHVREIYDMCVKYDHTQPQNVDFLNETFETYQTESGFQWGGAIDLLFNADIKVISDLVAQKMVTFSLEEFQRHSDKETLEKLKNAYAIDGDYLELLAERVKNFEDVLESQVYGNVTDSTEIGEEDDDEEEESETEDDGIYTIDEFTWEFPSFDYRALKDETLHITEVKVKGIKKVKRFQKVANAGPIRDYIYWRTLKSMLFLKTFFEEYQGDDAAIRAGCSSIIYKNMPHETAYIFSTKYFDLTKKEDVTGMLQQIRDELRTTFDSSTWLGPAVKAEALRKLDNIKSIVGAPDDDFDKSFIAGEESKWYVDQDHFLKTVFTVIYRKSSEAEVGPREARAWREQNAIESNAFYTRQYGTIVILLGVLTHPFYNIHFPNFYKYGNLGVTVGHEFMHAFDSEGVKHDSEFKKRTWITPRLQKKFVRNMECFYNQYIKKYAVDGILTMPENLPDNVGLEVAFKAYKAWAEGVENVDDIELDGLSELDMDKYKAYFLSNAQSFCATDNEINPVDPHPPNRVRVMATFSNSKDFAETFNCPVGSTMNPRRKCNYWS